MWGQKWAVGTPLACLLFLVTLMDADPFQSRITASQFLSRHRRANSLFEESKKGNLERECIEELCNKEEAREIFENQPETEYFYPRYVVCLGSHRVGINNQNSDSSIPSDLRTCVKEISNQCTPFPCSTDGSERCVDGQASFTCVCKPGWKGRRCEEDIDECTDPYFTAGCNQKCLNFPGSFRCMCEDGYFINDNINCVDINECLLYPSLCEKPAECVNTPGMYECRCPPGFKYNFTSKSCDDVNECSTDVCERACHNTVGSFKCQCDGREGFRLGADERSCEHIPVCVQLDDYKHPEMLYLGEQFAGLPVIYLLFRLPENTKFSAEFDFRTYDPEGIILYAESSQDSWFMLGLRAGRIEVQFKNQHTVKVTTGRKAINDGQWHVISVDELESSISVKISKEAVMSINSPESLFASVNGKLETKVYIAGLPNRTNNIIKPINPRLDGCIRGWNLMNQGASGVKEVIQEKKSKHCFVYVEPGSYFSGAGLAQFHVDYSDSGSWNVDLTMNIRPSSSSGVLFALVYNDTVPLSVAVVTQGEDDANLQVFLDGVSVARLDSLMLCYPDRLAVHLNVTPTKVRISANSSTVSYMKSGAMQEVLERLNATMQNPISTYVGGIPDNVPLHATPVSAFYHGCMDVTINGQQLDFDEALSKHNSIKSHSCPPVSTRETHPEGLNLHRK
ncbi:vitamin K-dependent protein S isoform X2 [Austrofundulus limnaeus]|uniref:Vitamin K-dependent protein S n=1 Tax=Austrofundulus limnaeus TaxID=52670 RepID=A0A2I4ASN4_AUSLI|nr:PREDICTED: vitamin K-dependent protein S isoform X2 [Austrofundulus limnaeus]